MTENRLKMYLNIILPLAICLVSFFGFSNLASDPKFHTETIAYLDEKKTTVLELTAAATATSVAITLLPGDTATPIAEELVNLSSTFLLVIGAIFLEKYLLTITGFAAFKILIPVSCILWIINIWIKKDAFKNLVAKLSLFALVIFLVVPTSVQVSKMIENTYGESIQETIEQANQATKDIEKKEEKGFFEEIIDGVQNGISDTVNTVKNSLNNFIEALAVLIVTSCVIPVLILLFFVWIIKLFIGLDIDVTKYTSGFSSKYRKGFNKIVKR